MGHVGNRRRGQCGTVVPGEFAGDIVVVDRGFSLAKVQAAEGVKRLQLAHTVYFGQQKTNSADDPWQNADMMKNTDQRGKKDDRAPYFQ